MKYLMKLEAFSGMLATYRKRKIFGFGEVKKFLKFQN